MKRFVIGAVAAFGGLALSACGGSPSAVETVYVTASQPAASTAPPSAPPSADEASPSAAPENTEATEEVATEPTEEPVPYADLTCAQLAEEAVAISEDQDIQLLKVRAAKILKDRRATFQLPKGDKEVVVLSCKGTGVWSDLDRSPVVVSLVIDADGEEFIQYQEQ